MDRNQGEMVSVGFIWFSLWSQLQRTSPKIPEEISILFQDSEYIHRSSSSPPFFHLLAALEQFTALSPYALPLTPALPDMKADTVSYIHLQRLYKAQADEDKRTFMSFLPQDGPEIPVAVVDDFVKNCHAIRHLKGTSLANLEGNERSFIPAALY